MMTLMTGLRGVVLAAAALSISAHAAQDAAPPAAPVADAAIARELRALQALLAQVPESFGRSRKWCAPNPCSDIAVRLAVFRWRFGTDPRLEPQWPALAAAAQALLDRLDNPATRAPLSDYDVARQMDRSVLLDLVGRADEAQAILENVRVFGADGCHTCTADNGFVVYQRRSEACERAGDLAGALRWQQEACFELPDAVIGGGQHPSAHLMHARYGLLLCSTGHGTEGEGVLRFVVRVYPGSIGAELAQAELARRGVAVDEAQPALDVVILEWGGYCRMTAALVLTDAARPGWLQILAARLPNTGDEWGSHTATFDPEGFEQLRPALETNLLGNEQRPWMVGPALRLAQGLRGGAAPYVEPLLAQVSGGETSLATTGPIDAVLRWVHGGGPSLSRSLNEGDGAQFAGEWRAWLAAR